MAAETRRQPAIEQTPAGRFESQIDNFLDTSVILSAPAQLEIMDEFWQRLGYEVPDTTAEELYRLSNSAKATPNQRIIPIPLSVRVSELKQIAANGRSSFAKNLFTNEEDALWTPRTGVYSEVTGSPNESAVVINALYSLRHRTHDQELPLTKLGYGAALIRNKLAVSGRAERSWLFPIIDVQRHTDRSLATPEELFERVEPTVTPTALLAVQLLHQVIGNPSMDGEIDIANEAVYRLDDSGRPAFPTCVSGITWISSSQQLYLYDFSPESIDERFGVRDAANGLTA